MDTSERPRWREPKMCFIPTCSNNDIKNPEKQFFAIRKELKENWCNMADRNCPKRRLYCCNDHINVEEDLENYEKWISGAKPRLKINTILKNIPLKAMKPNSSLNISDAGTASTSNADDMLISQTTPSASADVQGNSIFAVANKYVMVKPVTADKSTNFRARKTEQKVMPSLTSDLVLSEESPRQSASLFGSSNFDSTASSSVNYTEKTGRENIMKRIQNKPKMYLGVPKSFWWIIDFIAQQCLCVALHIIMTLFKLKNNDTFSRMSEEFDMARSTIALLFHKNVLVLATYFQNFIYLPTPEEIKKKLPFVFKIRYSNVQCIIDCFEIQIQKPTDPVRQAQTWSQYKSCNTVKYLIGCTPSGFISFISEGYGGRISDKAITEKSGFIDILPSNAVIMADRGFKEIESLLSSKYIKLLRPPSVFANKKLSKKEVIQTKVIASLRVHIERVIRRVREFQMLKPHSVVNNKHMKYLDELVVIACGLINLQDPIIKDF